MDASREQLVFLAVSEHRKVMQRFEVHLKHTEEEIRRRRRALMSALLRDKRRVTLRTGTDWEVMLNLDDDAFAQHFRVTKTQVEYLQLKLQENGIEKEHSRGLPPVPPTKKLLMFLWFMTSQSSFRQISHKFDVSQSSAHRSVLEVLHIVSTVGRTFVCWPNPGEKRASAAAFQQLCGLSGVIGVIDGCHVKVQRPQIRGGDYMNTKSFYSVLLQGIVDERGRFIDIFAGPPGRLHDARMLRASNFYSTWEEKLGEYSLLGDGAYTGQDFPFVITPKSDDGALSEADQLQNSNMSRGREVVDRAFGRLKCKWRRLRDLQNSRIDAVVMIIMAACFLHNLCTDASERCQEHPHGCPRQRDGNE